MSGRVGALLTVAVTGLVASAMAVTGVDLVLSGQPLQVGVGLGVLLLVVVGVVLVAGEVRLGAASARLARRLEAEGGLPEDSPERLPSGRLPKGVADAVFEARKAEVEAAPDDWRAWWRLAAAYGDARDTPRGRQALRRAVALEREDRG